MERASNSSNQTQEEESLAHVCTQVLLAGRSRLQHIARVSNAVWVKMQQYLRKTFIK